MSESSIVKELRVTLETVTPLFLGGANQEPEIRAPSFRGGMRYWLRAILGVQHGSDLTRIQEIEEEVFGSTKMGSSIAIRANEISREDSIDFQNLAPDSGLGYLLWTAKNTNRHALQATKTTIQVIVSCKSNEAFACASFWLLIHLGGLGSRSRRGLGSLKVVDVEGWNSTFPPLHYEGKDVQSFLHSSLKKWLEVLGIEAGESAKGLSIYDSLHPAYCEIYTSAQTWDDWESALEGVGNLLKEFRAKTPPDHEGVLSAIKGVNSPKTVARAIFGLPMQFYFSGFHQDIARKHPEYEKNKKYAMRETRGYATASITPSIRTTSKKLERRASPIHLKFTTQSDGRLILVGTLFKSDFLPKDYQLRIAPGGKDRDKKKPPKYASQPEYKLLEDFFNNTSWAQVYGERLSGEKK